MSLLHSRIARGLKEKAEAHQNVFERLLANLVLRASGGDEDVSWAFIKRTCISYTNFIENSYCDSPIEEMLLAGLLFADDGYNYLQAYTSDHYDRYYGENGVIDYDVPITDFGTVFIPQAQMGKYRVDFLFISHVCGEVYKLIVECDGHNYHEKTKQQASRDKKRDREITALGIPVLRFTGSDIYNKLDECLDEISSFLYKRITNTINRRQAA